MNWNEVQEPLLHFSQQINYGLMMSLFFIYCIWVVIIYKIDLQFEDQCTYSVIITISTTPTDNMFSKQSNYYSTEGNDWINCLTVPKSLLLWIILKLTITLMLLGRPKWSLTTGRLTATNQSKSKLSWIIFLVCVCLSILSLVHLNRWNVESMKWFW